MKKVVAYGILLISLFSLTGCFEQEIKTAEYFKTHPDEMEKVVSQCQKAQKLTDSQKKECENAIKAQAMKNYFKPASKSLFDNEPQDINKTK